MPARVSQRKPITASTADQRDNPEGEKKIKINRKKVRQTGTKKMKKIKNKNRWLKTWKNTPLIEIKQVLWQHSF